MKKSVALLCSGLVCFAIIGSSMPKNNHISAETTASSSSTTQTVSDMQENKADLNSKKESEEEVLKSFEKEKKNIVGYIEKLDKKLNSLQSDIDKNEAAKEKIEKDLDKAKKALAIAKAAETNQYAIMKARCKYIYENGNNNYFDAIFNAKSFGNMMNRITYVSQVMDSDKKLFSKLKTSREDIEAQEQDISAQNDEVTNLNERLNKEKKSVQTLISDKNGEVEKYNHNISSAQNLISSYTKDIQDQENQIAAAEAAANAAASKASNPSNSNGQGDNGGDNSTPVDIPKKYKGGKFAWPVPGKYTITSNFGYRVHPLTGVRTLHGGIDIEINTGDTIVAAADGTVQISQYSSSAGNYVMINHGGGICTVYMHNSSLCVAVGDKVKKGQKIAEGGSTGWSTGPHCHFGVRVNGKYVNPLPYLK